MHDADDAINLGSVGQSGGNPFLNIKLLIQVALQTGADAIHPGYGYLSENAQFADEVRKAGIIFIGPNSSAITTLGDKREAKQYLSEHEPSVPLIPGYIGSSSQGIQLSDLEKESERIGFPVIIKASAGGGGRGLRIVHDRSALKAEFERAQSEAQRSFGLNVCILEKYIEAGKHIEVQILGDQHGNVISLWERDCSVQRRHQKVIEESPCPWLNRSQREAICAVATRIGRLLRYEGAGTVEFILDIATGQFYFLEVNARLQVEHPITEECTGLDIVALQLYVASGGNLASLQQLDSVPQNGHAIECRLCAEDPARNFAPQHGLVRLWAPPLPLVGSQRIRYETAISSGAKVSIYFDSMIAKIVVWAPTRAAAIEQMARVLADTACLGVTTNQLFLQACLRHQAFHRPDYTTSFIQSNLDDLLRNPYSSGLGLPLNLLSIIPSLFLRNSRERKEVAVGGARPIFGSVRRGFRNQRFDRVNQLCDIVAVYDAKQGTSMNSQICIWGFDGGETNKAVVQIAPVPELGPKPEAKTYGTTSDESGLLDATRAYNMLSVALRSGALEEKSLTCAVYVHKAQSKVIDMVGWSESVPWNIGRIEASINKSKVLAYVATGDPLSVAIEQDTGSALRLLCHFPVLGGPMEFHCYSPLSYFESQRPTTTSGGKASDAVINAPMPCKVLQVLKKAGDKVKAGEVVMVIESMKMEIAISAGMDGLFETSIAEGDAVNEGAPLCTFT